MADQIRDIAVEQDKKKSVSDAAERINLLFNVQVTLSAPEAAGIQWVQLKGSVEDIENAKVSKLTIFVVVLKRSSFLALKISP